MTIYELSQLIVLAIVVERITEIIVDSTISEIIFRGPLKRAIYPTNHPPEDTIKQHFLVFVDKLTSCGYCTSVWIAAAFSWCLEYRCASNMFFNWVCATMILHGLSNLYHVLYHLVKKGRVNTYDILVKGALETDNKIKRIRDGISGQSDGPREPSQEVSEDDGSFPQ